MVAVLLYHAGLPVRGGFAGVDVFFVISGFLITGLLLREIDTTGTISWPRFVARRVRRLLPAAVTVLVTTALAAWWLVPGLRRRGIGLDVASAAGYVVNWRFAGQAVDYLAKDARPSPVQHFWSLSVEEQFYLIWPLSLLAVVGAVRAIRALRRMPAVDDTASRRFRNRAVGVALAGLALPSLAWSLWQSHANPAGAYFVTTTRAWELGLGAALALVLSSGAGPPLTPRVRGALGWAGLGAIVVTVVAVPEHVSWPGWWALVPTLGAVAVIAAGAGGQDARGHVPTTASSGAGRLLSVAPVVWVGGMSYSLYLWHWPILSLTEWALGGLTTQEKVVLTAASVVPAWLSLRLIEEPLRRGRLLRGTRPVLVGGATLSLVAVLAGLPDLTVRSSFPAEPAAFDTSVTRMGAAALSVSSGVGPTAYERDRWNWVTPDPEAAGTDRPAADVNHCQVHRQATEPVPCTFGDRGGRRTLALVGDSKAMQWLPALRRIARREDWRIVTYGKSSCTFADATTELAGRPYPACDAWNARVMSRLRRHPPDVLVTSGTARHAWTGGHGSGPAMVAGLAARWRQVRALGTQVVVIGDNPRSPDDLDVCAARHPRTLSRCRFPARPAVASSALPLQRRAVERVPGTRLVDLSAWICPDGRCPVAIGHVTVNRPGDHITATYAATLAPQIAPAVVAAVDPIRGRAHQ